MKSDSEEFVRLLTEAQGTSIRLPADFNSGSQQSQRFTARDEHHSLEKGSYF